MLTRHKFFAVLFVALLAAQHGNLARAAAISLNFGLGTGAPAGNTVGANVAGVVSVGNWNDIPVAQQTNLALIDSAGATVSGLTLSTAQTYVFTPSAATSSAAWSPASAGNTAMMRGHIYRGGNVAVDLTFTGTIPYSTFDIYVYYNSGAVVNAQTFSILDSSLGSLGLALNGAESNGADTQFVQSNYIVGVGSNNANYVKFSGLTSANVPANFVIRAQGNGGVGLANQYAYFNGLQIVQVPEPTSIVLGIGACMGLAMFRRRCDR